MTLKKIYFDGTTKTETAEGIFNGVNMNEYTVQYSPARPLIQIEEETSLEEAVANLPPPKLEPRKRGESEGLKLWSSLDNAMSEIAKISVYGGCMGGCDGNSQNNMENMHNIDPKYWQSEAAVSEIATEPEKYSRGFTVQFENIVDIESFTIQIDPNRVNWYLSYLLFSL